MEGRLLLVDDEAAVLDILSEYFVAQGYDVETATSGEDALQRVRDKRPDLVMLDVRMPGLDGVEVLTRLRAMDPGVAVIMVTANEDVELARQTLKLGAFDYVAKPFDFDYLTRAASAALLHVGGSQRAAASSAGTEAWPQLVLAVFRAARDVAGGARRSTADRLEQAALAAARHAGAGRIESTREQLAELQLLLDVAVQLGDLDPPARDAVAAAVGAARRTLPAA
jgi:DNA-binding response OmpR family regulator